MSFDETKAEKQQINSLIGKGMEFQVDGKKYVIQEPPAGVLDLISSSLIEIQIDEERMNDNPLSESKQIVAQSAKLCARVVAIAVLGNKCRQTYGYPNTVFFWKRTRFKLIERWTEFFFTRVKPSDLAKLALIINTMCNYGDFINSIRLMSGARTTAPNRIDQKEQA